jgi:hypothetical protein
MVTDAGCAFKGALQMIQAKFSMQVALALIQQLTNQDK